MFDIDIDLADRKLILDKIVHIPASLENSEHLTGIYITNIPTDVINNRSSINYKEAESRGYLKIDLLNLHIYKDIKDYDHYSRLLNKEPTWELLKNKEICEQLIHIGKYHHIIRLYDIDSIEKLAAFIAILRPAKKYLIGKQWEDIFNEVWKKPDNDLYFYKKSHAIAYAMAIVIQLNLIEEFTFS